MKTFGTATWAYLTTPDTKFDPCWRITVAMDDNEAKKLKDLGVVVKRNDDGVFEHKFKRNVARKNGGDNQAPRVVDANKNPFNEIIGNGSKVWVQWAPFQWKFKKGVGTDLQAVQVIELVPYGGDSNADEFEAVENPSSPQESEAPDEF